LRVNAKGEAKSSASYCPISHLSRSRARPSFGTTDASRQEM
jgi:hypothetical protein